MLTIMRLSLMMLCCVGSLHAKIVAPGPTVSTQETHQGQEIVIKNNQKRCEHFCGFSLGSITKLPRAEDLVITKISRKDYVIVSLKAPSCAHALTEEFQQDTFLISDIFSEKPSLWNTFKEGMLTLRLKMESTGTYFDITAANFSEQPTVIHAASAHPHNLGTMK